jgi:hypothetical protein
VRPVRWLLLALVAGALASCGGDSEDTSSTDSAKPQLTVPGEKTGTSETTPRSTDTSPASTGTAPSGGGSTTGPMDQPNPGNGGVPAPDDNPQPGGSPPDSPSNDTPPKPGSPADRFEQFCAQNPGAC